MYKSPIPPCDEGVLINILAVFILCENFSIFSVPVCVFTYKEAVCPSPPSSINCSAFSTASSNEFALYIASTGDSFSWANSSDKSTLSTSPINIFVFSGTSTPANSAILWAFWPTIFEFKAPFIIIVFLTFSVSSLFKT